MQLFISYLFTDPRLFFAVAVIVTFSICTHEFCHAYAALCCGDDTARANGFLTFNPFRQMGVWSLITFLVFGLAWGRVPVDLRNFRHRWQAALVAAVGPLCNLLLAQLFIGLMLIVSRYLDNDFAVGMLFQGAVINYLMAAINALPLPGLDGGAILKLYWPTGVWWQRSEFSRGVLFVLIALLLLYFNVIAEGIGQFARAQVIFLAERIYG